MRIFTADEGREARFEAGLARIIDTVKLDSKEDAVHMAYMLLRSVDKTAPVAMAAGMSSTKTLLCPNFPWTVNSDAAKVFCDQVALRGASALEGPPEFVVLAAPYTGMPLAGWTCFLMSREGLEHLIFIDEPPTEDMRIMGQDLMDIGDEIPAEHQAQYQFLHELRKSTFGL